MRKVDKLGRIVIPQELRKKYGLTTGAQIEFIDVGEGITVRPFEPYCKICHHVLSDDTTLSLCDTCITEVINTYQKKKGAVSLR